MLVVCDKGVLCLKYDNNNGLLELSVCYRSVGSAGIGSEQTRMVCVLTAERCVDPAAHCHEM